MKLRVEMQMAVQREGDTHTTFVSLNIDITDKAEHWSSVGPTLFEVIQMAEKVAADEQAKGATKQ